MAQTAAHLVERVIPWVPTRQWVVLVPVPLRYWMASSQDLTAKVHTIMRTTMLTGPRCASVQGISLHVNTQVPAHRRDQLERLMRSMARGALALERLSIKTHNLQPRWVWNLYYRRPILLIDFELIDLSINDM
jgi:hypothetical protein